MLGQPHGTAELGNSLLGTPEDSQECQAGSTIDGVHVDLGPSALPKFLPALELQPEEVARVNADAIRRIHRALRRAGRPDLVRSMDGNIDHDRAAAEPPTDDPGGSLLPFLHAASIQDRIALGPKAGRPIPRLRDPAADLRPASQGLANPPSLTAESHGFSLHAATRVEAGDPERLERLVRYVARPPLSQGLAVLRRPHCGGRRRRIALITDPLTCRQLLRHIGSSSEPLLLAPARPPPQQSLEFA